MQLAILRHEKAGAARYGEDQSGHGEKKARGYIGLTIEKRVGIRCFFCGKMRFSGHDVPLCVFRHAVALR